MSISSNNKTIKLEGLRVFVVEDEALVAMNLEMILEDLGCIVVGPAMRLEKAEAMVCDGFRADAAILDINVGGREVFPLAERLSDMKVPIVFTTGYSEDGLPAEWLEWPILTKPYTAQHVARGLYKVLRNRDG